MIKEYYYENGKKVDNSKLQTGKIPLEDYKIVHKASIICCHDVFITYNGGILLVTRDNLPAKDVLWPVGGRIQRGFSIEESLKKKALEECGLELANLINLGIARTTFQTDPFGHRKGTDSLNIAYFAVGKGKLKLDNLHKNPVIIVPKGTKTDKIKGNIEFIEYSDTLKEKLEPYVSDFLEFAIECLKR